MTNKGQRKQPRRRGRSGDIRLHGVPSQKLGEELDIITYPLKDSGVLILMMNV